MGVTTYAILVKGEKDSIAERTDECIRSIADCCSKAGGDVNWHIACVHLFRGLARSRYVFRMRAVYCPVDISARMYIS